MNRPEGLASSLARPANKTAELPLSDDRRQQFKQKGDVAETSRESVDDPTYSLPGSSGVCETAFSRLRRQPMALTVRLQNVDVVGNVVQERFGESFRVENLVQSVNPAT